MHTRVPITATHQLPRLSSSSFPDPRTDSADQGIMNQSPTDRQARESTIATTTRFFQSTLRIGDLVIIALVMLGSHLARFGPGNASIVTIHHGVLSSYMPLGAGIVLTWWFLLAAMKSYREHLLGYGPDEYHRVFQATITEFGGLALVSYLAGVELSRGYFLVALPTGLASLLVWRWLARRGFVNARKKGAFTHPTFIVGSPESVPAVIKEIARRPELGLTISGIFLSNVNTMPSDDERFPAPVIGDASYLVETIEGADGITVIIARDSGLKPSEIRRLSWVLGPTSRLVMVPSMLDVAGPRIHLRPVDGIALIEIQVPRFDGARLFLKRLFDVLLSTALIVALAPMWLMIPALVWVEDRGPVFFRQTRVGLNGREFRIWKFRTMHVNADVELAALLARQGTSDKPLFKVADDPRITRVGQLLRRTSLDEIPQLLNVLEGTMSLVGPRPQVPAEVELYDDTASRRLLTKPGMTGLWQVNGRSSLTWEEALRFDLFYVENWTLSMDIRVLFRTLRVVIAQEGSA